MSLGLVTAFYIAAAILFILALGGLSNQETAKRAIWYGIVGMALAVVAIILLVTVSFPLRNHYQFLRDEKTVAQERAALEALLGGIGAGLTCRSSVLRLNSGSSSRKSTTASYPRLLA